ncbi:DUF1768-domain-containing protein [Cutaneotrichosporon oleaginosum]|uniref:DUF1768-domain-containing protein n=1 Tax=Cutaneotrichosporon oleaginosum TaxID=879819 RepID=A0A0J0XRN3_9TREE|nr:DUF1768-domain-containing protein [Cutaneotrichosporon oleaginosum]KLT43737.1 DUF1768-domain-containing protein [Cutaneotrichosporon oleaginosum]TXT05154.1 hypothetical protein COLE_06474 [Cutaneotrichosporon oleaginosum]
MTSSSSKRAPPASAKPKPAAPHPNDDLSYPYYFFYGHAASNPTGALSQWHLTSFTEGPHTFTTAEHYMMYHKAMLFEPAAAPAILAAPGPREAKALGRKVANFSPKTWEARCDAIVEQGNYLKFTQNPDAWAVLSPARTGTKALVEAAARDAIWGIGMGWERARGREAQWGQNRLGKALTRVRARIVAERDEAANGSKVV